MLIVLYGSNGINMIVGDETTEGHFLFLEFAFSDSNKKGFEQLFGDRLRIKCM